MTTGLFTHPACLAHETPPGHPECADRLRAVLHALEDECFQYLSRHVSEAASREALLRTHSAQLVDRILGPLAEEAARETYVHLDADTVMSAGSAEAALRAAGAVIEAVNFVMNGALRNAFCAVRPPGHHAERDRAMGFCLFNNVAVGAHHARAVHGLERVAIIDFDVHHGNGSQDIAFDDPGLFYASTHQSPLYPGTGATGERGTAGNVLNVPLPPGADGAAFRAAMSEPRPAGAGGLPAGICLYFRGVRCPPRRSAGRALPGRGGFRLGHGGNLCAGGPGLPGTRCVLSGRGL